MILRIPRLFKYKPEPMSVISVWFGKSSFSAMDDTRMYAIFYFGWLSINLNTVSCSSSSSFPLRKLSNRFLHALLYLKNEYGICCNIYVCAYMLSIISDMAPNCRYVQKIQYIDMNGVKRTTQYAFPRNMR